MDTFLWQRPKEKDSQRGNQALYWFSACTVFLNTSSAYNIVSLKSSSGIIEFSKINAPPTLKQTNYNDFKRVLA